MPLTLKKKKQKKKRYAATPSGFAAGHRDNRGYKPTIRERQSPSLRKDPSWVRKERIPSAKLGKMVKKIGVLN